jgi:hypothetical protein
MQVRRRIRRGYFTTLHSFRRAIPSNCSALTANKQDGALQRQLCFGDTLRCFCKASSASALSLYHPRLSFQLVNSSMLSDNLSHRLFAGNKTD